MRLHDREGEAGAGDARRAVRAGRARRARRRSTSPSMPRGTTSNTPVPRSRSTLASAVSSASSANVPGTSSPRLVWWARMRDVETPSAPASIPARVIVDHGREVVGRRDAGTGARAHHVGAHRRVRHVRADVDHAGAPRERVEILGERLPLPVDALPQRGAGDVLDALHQLDELLLASGVHRREPDAAVAHHHGRHAVPARRARAASPTWPDRRSACARRRSRA